MAWRTIGILPRDAAVTLASAGVVAVAATVRQTGSKMGTKSAVPEFDGNESHNASEQVNQEWAVRVAAAKKPNATKQYRTKVLRF
jgi:hypothetical protein